MCAGRYKILGNEVNTMISCHGIFSGVQLLLLDILYALMVVLITSGTEGRVFVSNTCLEGSKPSRGRKILEQSCDLVLNPVIMVVMVMIDPTM